jgi:CDP-diacylglycerol--glycerol-3-phosphate 3-phosphatidyltransferase
LPSEAEIPSGMTKAGQAPRATILDVLRHLVEIGVAPTNPARTPSKLIDTDRQPRLGPLMRRLPNALTVSRILAAPLIGALLMRSQGHGDWTAGLIFGGVALTDQFDGLIARIWHAETAFGKVADPLADKLLIGTAILCLTFLHRLPLLAFALPLARHILLWAYRFVSPRHGMLASSWAGKLSAYAVYTAVGLIIVTTQNHWWALWLLWIGIALNFADLVKYAREVTSDQSSLPVVQRRLNYFTQRNRGRKWMKTSSS